MFKNLDQFRDEVDLMIQNCSFLDESMSSFTAAQLLRDTLEAFDNAIKTHKLLKS